MAITPYMSLSLPTVSSTPGPDWATSLNAALTVVDGHTHQDGSGQPITSAAISINADLTFANYNATNLRSARLYNQSAALSLPSDITCLYSVNGNLYYNNAAGQQIQLTAGNALNAASIGAIGGDYATSTASLFYTSASSKFTFWSNTNIPALVDFGPLTVRNNTSGSFGVSISPNVAIAANYSLTLPAALPSATNFMTLSSSGQVAATIPIANGITQSMLQTRPTGTSVSTGGVAQSTGSGSFSHTGTSVSAGVVSATIVTTGRPVFVGLVANTPDGYLASSDPSNVTQTTFYLARGATDIAWAQVGGNVQGVTGVEYRQPVSSLWTIDYPSAGTYTYTVKVANNAAGTTGSLVNAAVVAYEI